MVLGSAVKVELVGLAKIGGKDGGGGKLFEVLGEDLATAATAFSMLNGME
jgi:hypothetical protein